MKKKFIVLAIIGVFILFFAASLANGQRVVNTPYVEWVSHTEYWSSSGVGSGEQAATIVRLTNYRGDPFVANNCTASIFYPNKTAYVSNGIMNQSPVVGNWYRYDSVPDVGGTYEQAVQCSYNGGVIITSQSFHVNPALNFIKTVSADVLSASTKLTNVNATVTALVQNSTAEIKGRIDLEQSTLTSLTNAVNSSLSSQLTNVQGDLTTKLQNVNISIQTKITETGQTIVTQVQSTETNLTNLMNSMKSQLQAQLNAVNASLNASLSNTTAVLSGKITDATNTILVQILATETNLTNYLNSINTSVRDRLNAINASLDSKLVAINYSLSSQLGNTQTSIQTQLTSVNTTLSNLITTAQNDIKSYIQVYLPAINQTANNIYNNTQWLITNAINHNSDTTARFNSVDANLTIIEGFCSNLQTNSSDLCKEAFAIRRNLTTLRTESQNYFDTLNQTTVNIYDKITGDVTNSLNSIAANVLFVKGQTTDINSTVQQIRQDQTGEVRVTIIS